MSARALEWLGLLLAVLAIVIAVALAAGGGVVQP